MCKTISVFHSAVFWDLYFLFCLDKIHMPASFACADDTSLVLPDKPEKTLSDNCTFSKFGVNDTLRAQ